MTGWILRTFRSSDQENFGAIENICTQLSGLLLSVVFTLHCQNGGTYGSTAVLHQENCIDRTAKIQEETEIVTILLLETKTAKVCSDISMVTKFSIESCFKDPNYSVQSEDHI